MATTHADFTKYAPSNKASLATVTPLLARADRWVARETSGVAGLTLEDVKDAACAYALHLLVLEEATASLAKAGQRIKLEDRGEVTFAQANPQNTQNTAQDWVNKAWQHLYDAGLSRSSGFAGVSK